MTGFSINIELDAETARANLNSLLERMANPRPFYKAAGDLLLASTFDQFNNERAPDGTPWAPLAAATIRARVRRGRSQIAILRETGQLRGSVKREVRDDGVEIGATAHYAAIHQFGGTIDAPERAGKIYRRQFADGSFGRRFAKRKNKTTGSTDVTIGAHRITIPARPFLGVSADDQADIIALARRWLEIE